MFDGSVKSAGEIIVGDVLAGDDTFPRIVLSTCRGIAPMAKITPANGKSFKCTWNHLLTVYDNDNDFEGDDVMVNNLIHPLSQRRMMRRFDHVKNTHSDRCSFEIELVDEGPFAGFEVDRNHRFLLADGTVTHNSAKTSWMGRFAVVQMVAWLVDAQVYVSGPYKLHTDDKAWASLKDWAKHLQKTKSRCMSELGLRVSVQTETVSISNQDGTSAAQAKFVSLEAASAVQGKKSDDHLEHGLKGIILVIVDEFIENPALRLKQAESNISSNFNYFGLLGCNPLPEKCQHPALKAFSDPVEILNLDRTVHFRWRTIYGICIRFAWLNCPNRILGRSVWPYLMVEERQKRQRLKGNDVLDAQVDAWGFGSGARGAPLTEAEIRMSGAYSEAIWQSPPQRLMVIDCAFGGQDPASATILEYGEVMVKARDGTPIFKRVFSGVTQQLIPVDSDFHATDEWLEEMADLMAYSGGSFPVTVNIAPIKAGDRLGGNWSLAHQSLLVMRNNNVLPGRVTFDSSQRGDCTNVMQDAFGRQNVGWFYEGSRRLIDEEAITPDWYRWPYRYTEADEAGNRRPQKWSEHCTQVSSMIWFFACELIKHGFLMNAETVSAGLTELCARPVSRGRRGQGEGKTDVLGKEKLKEMGQKSPTYGETLAMGLYFGTRFLNSVSLDAPELTTQTQFEPTSDVSFIKFGRGRGMNSSFKRLAFTNS